MAEASLSSYTDEVVEIIRSFIRLKPRLAVVLPEDLARLRARLMELHVEGGPRSAADFDLFLRISTVLSSRTEPVTMRRLSEALAVPMSTATRMIDWLVQAGYVERLSDPTDRRVVRVALTRPGRELHQTINQFLMQRAELFLRLFTLEEQDQLVALLHKAVSALEAMEV